MKKNQVELSLFKEGVKIVAGVDEAGRGACAGPLVASAVAIDNLSPLLQSEISDSKRLSEAKRQFLYEFIYQHALAVSVVMISPAEIDRHGLQKMNESAMRRAVGQLPLTPDYVLLDGYQIRGITSPSLSIWKGDLISLAIGAASIIAKVVRDREMVDLAQEFPDYGFDRHKGYATDSHMKAVKKFGVSAIHRKSYKNIARYIN
ncbi:MAG: ribonuclease HII [Actinobacteria bacterium]|nr:ribonuclease HII [Actinomycetota bacterium]